MNSILKCSINPRLSLYKRNEIKTLLCQSKTVTKLISLIKVVVLNGINDIMVGKEFKITSHFRACLVCRLFCIG